MRTHPLHPTLILFLACTLAFLFFPLDVAVSQGYLWGLYFLPIVMVFLWGRQRDIYLVAILGGALVLATYALDGNRTMGNLLFNHVLPLALLWAGAWLLVQRREMQEQLQGRERALDEQVKARTAELQVSEQRYRLLAENASDLVWAVDMDGALTYVSPSVQRLRGVTREVEQSSSWFDRMPPETAARAAAAIQADLAALRAGQPINATPHVAPAYRQDGTLLWSETLMSPLYDEDGRPQGLCGTTRDITARHQAEEALRASEERFARLFSSSPVGITLTRVADGVYLEVNDAFLALIGCRREEVIGRTSLELGVISPEDRLRLADALQEQGSLRGVDLVIHTNAGENLHTLYAVERVDLVGEPCVLSSVVDFTELKRLEEQLHDSEQKYRLLADNSPDVILATDSAGMLTFVSPAVARLTGFTPEEVCELPFAAQLAPASAEMLRREMAVQVPLFQARQAMSHPHFELETIRKDGSTLWLESLSSPQYDAGGSLVGFVVVLRDVTVRKRLEAALRQSELRYRLLVDNAEDVIWTVDLEGRFTFLNPSVERQLGYRPEELIGQRFDRWLTPASAAAAMERLAATAAQLRAGQSLEAMQFEGEQIRKDGTQIFTHTVGVPLLDDAGQPAGFQGITRDVTARKRLEAEWQELVDRWNMAAQMGAIGIWDWRAGSDAVIWDERMCLLHGLTPGTPMTFTAWRALIHPDDRAAVEASSRKSGCEGTRTPVEYRVVLPDGALRHLLAFGGGFYDESGTPVRQLGISMDVTERKLAEARRQETNQRLQMAADAAGIGIWNWNFADNSLEWDDRMCELYAVPEERRRAGITYDFWRTCIHPDDLALADPSQGEPSCVRSQSAAVYRIVLPSGAVRYIETRSMADNDNSGRPWRVIGINRDITDQKLYELLLHDTNVVLQQRVAERTAELRSALTNLQRANRLKDEFMAMISHELRTPLTGVLSMSEMLADEIAGPLNDRQATYVKGIGASGERLLAVINGILGYTHLLSGKVELHAEPCGLAYLLNICAASQQLKAAEKNQSIAVRVEPPDLTITSDTTALAEVLKRLFDNAVKFTPAGGQIGLEAQPTPGASDGTAPYTVDLVVWDTGIGIAADQLGSILKPFTQAATGLARDYEGLGLGLAYVDQMVSLLGGTIGVDSKPGAGTRFTITLPAHLAT